MFGNLSPFRSRRTPGDYRFKLRLTWIGQVVLLWVTVAASAVAAENSAPRPNIIFILADDLGYGDLGCYGQKKIRTPNLDRMAQQGMKFSQCYAGSTVCAPSRAALMTGLHMGHCRIRGNSTLPLLPEDVTVAELLKEAGYHTAALGKWGLGLENSPGHPNQQGFDEWFGYLDQVHAHDYFPVFLWRNEHKLLLEKNLNDQRGSYSHDWFTATALNFISLKRDRPFFLYLAYTIPHAHSGNKTNGMPVPSTQPYTDEDWPLVEKNKAAMITRLDTDIGKIFERLQKLRLDEKTIVFFSSDNGPHREGGVNPAFFQSSGPLRGIKRDLYEGGIRVPMIVRWPGKIQAGTTSDVVWAFWDFLPTAAELGGGRTPEGIDGISMLPALLGRPARQHEVLYWEFHENGSKQAIRAGNWKGVRTDLPRPLELYDLKTDPGEENDLAKTHPDIVARLENLIRSNRTDSVLWPLRSAQEVKELKVREKTQEPK